MSVLIVGAGGLGCPAAMYLAGAGVGLLGIIDDDFVDLGNLHRQIGHSEHRKGQNKAVSLASALECLNSSVRTRVHGFRFTAASAESVIRQYDVVLDCTDNPGSRYLLNDVCVLLHVPLVSGAATGCDGQLSVYGLIQPHGDDEGRGQNKSVRVGPCYRCLYPIPPPPALVANCSDAGILGPVTGVIGSLQAMEVLKIAALWARQRKGVPAPAGVHGTPQHSPSLGEPLAGTLLVFDGSEGRMRSVKLRARRLNCAVCGDDDDDALSAVTRIRNALDSAAWCVAQGLAISDHDDPAPGPRSLSSPASPPCDCVLASGVSEVQGEGEGTLPVPVVTVEAFATAMDGWKKAGLPSGVVVLDVREPVQYGMVRLAPCVHLPLSTIQGAARHTKGQRDSGADGKAEAEADAGASAVRGLVAQYLQCSIDTLPSLTLYVICRRGVDSAVAVHTLRDAGIHGATSVQGGLREYAARVDTSLPWY